MARGRMGWLLLVLPLLAGLPFLAIGLFEVTKTARMVDTFVEAQGTVVGNSAVTSSEGGMVYVPEVRFFTRNEELVRFTDGTGTYPAEYEVGAHVNVIYNPEDVHDARINTWKRIWFGPVFLVGIGLLPLIISSGVIRLLRRRGIVW